MIESTMITSADACENPLATPTLALTYAEHHVLPLDITARLSMQSASPTLDATEHARLKELNASSWNSVYQLNPAAMYKDRRWIIHEFDELRMRSVAVAAGERIGILEVGCGVGNTLLPLCRVVDDAILVGIDCSDTAITLLRAKALRLGLSDRVIAAVDDIENGDIMPMPINIHYATAVFVLSALDAEAHLRVLKSLFSILAPTSGALFIRDYAVGDLKQMKFKDESVLASNFYVRHDKTRAFFFHLSELATLVIAAGFRIDSAVVCMKRVVNRKLNVTMDRRFVQIRARAIQQR